MQDDSFPAAEKILSDIENVVKRNPSLKSFEIVPADDNENRSPVFYREGSLGLASWCVQPLYCYAYRHLLELRRNHRHREEPSTLARWLLGALLLNPHVITFWNMRRELVRSHKLDASEDLSLIRLVLYHRPKCFEAFSYRRWLLSRIIDAKKSNSRPYDPEPENSPLCAELELIETCADRYANNYHAWCHRRYLLTLRETRNLLHPTLNSEWKSTLAWCERHVSDYSAHSYRQYLLGKCVLEAVSSIPSTIPKRRLLRIRRPSDQYYYPEEQLLAYINATDLNDCQKLLLRKYHDIMSNKTGRTASDKYIGYYLKALSYWAEECRVNEQLISMYDCHEVLWNHRRFLAYFLVHLVLLYMKDARYDEEIYLNPRIRDKLMMSSAYERYQHGEQICETNDSVIEAHMLLMDVFRAGNTRITELASQRNIYEKLLVEKFLKVLATLGFEPTT